jgi:hypothetical protein
MFYLCVEMKIESCVIGYNDLCENSKGFRRTELLIYHLAKFIFFLHFVMHWLSHFRLTQRSH